MKRTLLCLFLAPVIQLNAQVIVYEEDFESSPTTSVVNTFTDSVPDGPSPCGQASRGNASDDFNSTNVDFMSAQNPAYYLGLNPEDPCGGFYTASLASDTMDWSGYDSLSFSCKYYQSTTLGWGTSTLLITLYDGSTLAGSISSSAFSTSDAWDSVDVALPVAMISDSAHFSISMGGGEGVALDDLKVTGHILTFGIIDPINPELPGIYPNPAKNALSISGNVQHYTILTSMGQVAKQGNDGTVNLDGLRPGAYFVQVERPAGADMYRFIKQ